MLLVSCGRAPARLENRQAITYSIEIDARTSAAVAEALEPAIARFVGDAAGATGINRIPCEGAPIEIVVDIYPGLPAAEARIDEGNRIAWDTVLVPVVEFATDTPDASLKDCLDGSFRLALPDAVPEGFSALFVDGLALDDPGYALGARVVLGIRGKTEASRKAASSLLDSLRGVVAATPRAQRIRWLAAAGDMMLGRGASELLARHGAEALMGGAAAILSNADAAVVNLEGVVTAKGARASKSYTFRLNPSVAPMLAGAGIDAVLVSNNHALDWGMSGFTDMLRLLEDAGIGALGGGLDLDQASAPYEARGFRLYGLSSYPKENSGWDGRNFAAGIGTPGIMRAEGAGVAELAKGFREGVVDAVFVHGGTEWSTSPDASTRGIFHALIDAGADAVFGSHPHVVQAAEIYKGKPVFFSLGNFVFQGMQGTPGGQKGLLALVGFRGERAVYIRSIPLRLDGAGVDLETAR